MAYTFLLVLSAIAITASAQSCVPQNVHSYCTPSTCAADDRTNFCANTQPAAHTFTDGRVVMFDSHEYFSEHIRSQVFVARQFDGNTNSRVSDFDL